jgi:ribosome recycling factor
MGEQDTTTTNSAQAINEANLQEFFDSLNLENVPPDIKQALEDITEEVRKVRAAEVKEKLRYVAIAMNTIRLDLRKIRARERAYLAARDRLTALTRKYLANDLEGDFDSQVAAAICTGPSIRI